MATSSPIRSNGPIRRASHAGSWYSDNSRELHRQLDTWLNEAPMLHAPARAIVAPHAGYAYCGSTAAYAFKQIDPQKVNRVFVLGPSHHVCLSGCALTSCSKYRTPLGDLTVDQKITGELHSTGAFEFMDIKTDEAEHSIEMHLPYIAKVTQRCSNPVTIIPILVGSLSPIKHAQYGQILAPYLADSTNLFIISSDFCHWGHRFHFTSYDRSCGDVHEFIEDLDKEGMKAIETLDPAQFADYLKKSQNTICGRHPISVMLQAADHFRQMNNHKSEFKFLRYTQSNQCRSMQDSSVSYAAGSLIIVPR